ncbi:ATP-binding protein, partial [bacterium]|nr:ATP-binding protein [bacterium]
MDKKKVKLQVHHKIVPSISGLYSGDYLRVLMEYIDNSIDSADMHYYNMGSNSYRIPIEINVKIEGNNSKNGVIIIEDNCKGMNGEELERVVHKIGNSNKKAQGWTNGQFGFGVYSFMAVCNKLSITSKIKHDNIPLNIVIDKKLFEQDRDIEIDIHNANININKYGTRITLSKFEKDIWKEIAAEAIKCEVEKHFELILGRKNLKITVQDRKSILKKALICKPYDYKQYAGDNLEDTINKLMIESGKKHKKIETIILERPVS